MKIPETAWLHVQGSQPGKSVSEHKVQTLQRLVSRVEPLAAKELAGQGWNILTGARKSPEEQCQQSKHIVTLNLRTSEDGQSVHRATMSLKECDGVNPPVELVLSEHTPTVSHDVSFGLEDLVQQFTANVQTFTKKTREVPVLT